MPRFLGPPAHRRTFRDRADLVQQLARECTSLAEIAHEALLAMGWDPNPMRNQWEHLEQLPDGQVEPTAISFKAFDDMCRTEPRTHGDREAQRLERMLRDIGHEELGYVIRRAWEDRPTSAKLMHAMSDMLPFREG